MNTILFIPNQLYPLADQIVEIFLMSLYVHIALVYQARLQQFDLNKSNQLIVHEQYNNHLVHPWLIYHKALMQHLDQLLKPWLHL